MRKLFTITVLTLLIFISAPGHVLAGPGFGGGVSDAGHGGGGGAAPLDGGLSFLAIAGISYGVKKMKAAKDSRKNKEEGNELFK
ncbi:MAG: hypothetical protein P4L41_02065 [Flavipsychrobacter sp.]|nr:hypothetical protein [Flavipsychrobacter sp.]